jgi:hypothetical protein
MNTAHAGRFEVGTLLYKFVGWACIVFFLGCSIGAFTAKQYGPISVFAFFVLLGSYVVVSAGSYTLDDANIIHRNILGTYRISWTEVRQIEVGATDGAIVFHGEGTRFVLASPMMWSGKQKPDAHALLTRKISASGLTPYQSNTAGYKIHKNVRVSHEA